jgi:hypothetical protein
MSEFIVGYEIEILSPYTKTVTKNRINQYLNELIGEPPGRSKWVNCVDDESLSAGNHKELYCVEIVTYPFEEEVADNVLQCILGWASANGCKSNSTTGLHVNLSFKEKKLNHALNPLMMIINTPENDIAQYFKRTTNVYCVSWVKELTKLWNMCQKSYKNHVSWVGFNISEFYMMEVENFMKLVCSQIYPTRHNEDAPSQKLFKKLIVKFHSINFLKFAYDDYVEFRLTGGKNYHEDPAIFHSIQLYKQAMLASLETDTDQISKFLKNITGYQ